MTEPIWVELEKLLLKTEAPKRHAVIRTGERTPIPGHVRLAVHEWDTARCRVLRLFARAKERGEDLGGWHERRLIEDADHLTLAYCAHCNEPSMTAYPL